MWGPSRSDPDLGEATLSGSQPLRAPAGRYRTEISTASHLSRDFWINAGSITRGPSKDARKGTLKSEANRQNSNYTLVKSLVVRRFNAILIKPLIEKEEFLNF